jgi:hypothetical protein
MLYKRTKGVLGGTGRILKSQTGLEESPERVREAFASKQGERGYPGILYEYQKKGVTDLHFVNV